MEKYIVRVRSYLKDECIEYGTGIIIASNLVLTPKHVACGDRHTVWIGDEEDHAHIIKENGVAVVLEIGHSNDTNNIADIFSGDEILDAESMWLIDGFITSQQREHHVEGTGIIALPIKDEEWDYSLAEITIGMTDNFQGLSGSPVFCDNRIIGILQMQAHNDSGRLGVCMSSVNMFQGVLMKENFEPNEYKVRLKNACTQHTKGQIEKNVKSKKFIANIFVEEAQYKENLRYFADPMLFLKKAICDAKVLNLESVNVYLRQNGEQKIDFSVLTENFPAIKMEEVYVCLRDRILSAIYRLEELRKSNDSNTSSLEKYYDIRQNNLNNSVKYYLLDMEENVGFIEKKYILLTKDAGQGKTNFVCDFTLNFLMKKDYFVLYFNAYDFIENPMTLVKRKLLLDEMYSFNYTNKILLREWNRSKRPVIIVIDGLNENTGVREFGLHMRHFLEECQAYPYIKVIMTTRNEFLQERFAMIEEGPYSSVYKHVDMRQGDDFKGRIFREYLNFFRITIRENTLTRKFYDALVNDVLLLRFFCEVNEDKKQIYAHDVHKYDVFQKYLDGKSRGYQRNQQVLSHQDSFYALLDKISEYMIRKKIFFNVPSSIFNEPERKLLYEMLNNEVIFKSEQEVKFGMLTRNAVVISFTFDEFRDFCITNYVLTYLTDPPVFLNFWDQMNEENLTIREGVQKYMFYLARTKSQESLLPIIEKLPEYKNLYWHYVWDLEDQYFTAHDAEIWKKQLVENGPHAKKIVCDLIGKYDCRFFVNINIHLLFEALDILAEKIDLYDAFVKQMFGFYRQKRSVYTDPELESAYPFDMMIQDIAEHVNNDFLNGCHYSECYRMVIYLFELENRSAIDLWYKIYRASPEVAVNILDEMNRHKSSLILCNVKEILHHLKNSRNNDAYDLIIERLAQKNSFCPDTSLNWNSELFSKLLSE